ncbi:MAG: low-specificity L-threonine aldolase [Dehalococcoidia bacterium]|nr:MAG: low-specificity L-threonine aldolase [Dehalococcoidia bacterium]
MKVIDLRSDTVTHPTPEMRKAMFEAEVGDDVYGEDPTVNRLEAMAAEMMGKEAALFTTSGTQSNLTAVLTHTKHGDEIIVGDEAHMLWYEMGGAAALGGVTIRTVSNDRRGRLSLDDIDRTIRAKDIHYPETRLLCLENTHNRCGGTVLTPDYTNEVCDLAHTRGLKVYLDGARIFNATVALGVSACTLTQNVDSVALCLSKGLSAPVGSLLCGSKDFIERARKFRKMLGGGMRQAGVIAAAGIVALETMVERLAEDHNNARRLAQGLTNIEGITLAQDDIPTNIVMFDLSPELSVAEFFKSLERAGVKVGLRDGRPFRAVTHRMVSSSDIDEALIRIEAVCRRLRCRTSE